MAMVAIVAPGMSRRVFDHGRNGWRADMATLETGLGLIH